MNRDLVREKELEIIHKLGYENQIDLSLPTKELRLERISKEYGQLPLYSKLTDNSKLNSLDFNDRQKEAILSANDDGIPTKFLMFSAYSPERINAIHNKLVNDEDCTLFLDFTLEDSVAFLLSESSTPKSVRELDNLSMYDYNQLSAIIEAVDNDLDYSKILDYKIPYQEMQTIVDKMLDEEDAKGMYRGIKDTRKINVLKDMAHQLNGEQMNMLIRGANQVDKIELYANPDYSPRLLDLLLFRRDNYRLEDETNFDAHHVYEQVISDIFCASVVNRVDYDLSFERIYCLEFEYFTKLNLGVANMSEEEVKALYLDLFMNGVRADLVSSSLSNTVNRMELI